MFDPVKGQTKKRMEVEIEWLLVRDPLTQYISSSLESYASTVPFQFSLTRSVSAVEVSMYTFPPLPPGEEEVHSLNVVSSILTTEDVPDEVM